MTKLISLAGLSRFKADLPQYITDLGFIKNSVNDLANYYLKTQTYTKDEVQALISSIQQFSYEVVSTLPAASASTLLKIYLVPSENPGTDNAKDEFITIDKGEGQSPRYVWERIGSTVIDLSNYPTTAEMNAAIATAVANFKTESQIKAIVESYGYETSAHAEGTYVKKVTGKGLSTNDYTDSEKNKLAGIASNAQVNVLEGVKIDSDALPISDKKVTIDTASNSDIDNLFS